MVLAAGLLASFLLAQPQPEELKLADGVEAAEGRKPCQSCWVQPECPKPPVQNNQDINVSVHEFYDFSNVLPIIGNLTTNWSLYEQGTATYVDGVFSSTGDQVWLERNSPIVFNDFDQQVVYLTAKMDFDMVAEGVTSPLGYESDPSYGAAYMGMYDFVDTGLSYGFVITPKTVYAAYSRSPIFQTQDNFYMAFVYLVPIAPRQVSAFYTLAIDAARKYVGYTINEQVKLGISKSGEPIDSKFLVNDFGGIFPQGVFPSQAVVQVGIWRITFDNPHTACQEAIFNYCSTAYDIWSAQPIQCTYEPVQDPNTYTVDMQLVLDGFSLVTAGKMKPACGCLCIVPDDCN